jgi:hypothetical protein
MKSIDTTNNVKCRHNRYLLDCFASLAMTQTHSPLTIHTFTIAAIFASLAQTLCALCGKKKKN